MSKMRTVVLISGSGSNLQSLIDQQAAGHADIEIVGVISNVANVKGLQRARDAGINTAVLSHKDFDTRELFDTELSKVIDQFQPELVILAGFMRILSEEFVEKYQGKMLNIHPSLLPKYKGLHTHRRALEAGDSEHGLSIHFVTPELDGGPILIQAVVPVESTDTEESLAKKVQTQEHRLYPLAAHWFATGRIKLLADGITLDGNRLTSPICFNA